MKVRTHLLLVALMAVAVGLAFLQEPGFGDDLTYWTQALEVHERGPRAWERASFHDLRWPVWGVCWAIQRALGFGVSSYYGEPLLYLIAGALLAFALGRKLLDSTAAGWAAAIAFVFHPLLDSICFRPMPDLSEGVLGAAVIAAWWAMMNSTRRRAAWMLATGVLVFVAESNRVTGAFIVPVLIICTLAYFRRQFGWLVGAGAIAAACYVGEAAFYYSLFGDWMHNIHANMNNAGNKGTEPIPLWYLPFRFLSSLWKGNPLAPVYSVLAIVGIGQAWRRLGTFGRVIVLWFVVLYLEYSCTPQPVWPIRPLIRDADRFLAGLAVPISLLSVCGLWWLWEKLNAWRPVRAPAAALVGVAFVAMWAVTTRNRFDLGFVPEFRAHLHALPTGTKIFTHESMRAIAKLCSDDDVRRLNIDAPNRILQHTPELETLAAGADEFWYARKLVWLSTRKAIERGTLPKQATLGSYFDTPEREWTLVRLLAKGDTPDLIFYRRRTPLTPPAEILRPDAPEIHALAPTFPIEWQRDTGPMQISKKWDVPVSIRGKYVRLEGVAASSTPEAFTLRLKFKHAAETPAEYLLKPYLHRDGGKEFFVFTVPANADRCEVTLKFSPKTEAVRFQNFRIVCEKPL
ncbi:MAG: hypothetical protein ABMA13_17795 [Chthoniobacteraceae bacterium]